MPWADERLLGDIKAALREGYWSKFTAPMRDELAQAALDAILAKEKYFERIGVVEG